VDTVGKLYMYGERVHRGFSMMKTLSYNKITELLLNRDSHLTSMLPRVAWLWTLSTASGVTHVGKTLHFRKDSFAGSEIVAILQIKAF
jgi:hypothetical protein